MWGAEMIVYHGSQVEVNKPDVYHSRENVDFGKEFYITPIKDQACKWAARFKKRHGKAVVSAYDLELDKCKGYYSVLEFDELIDKEEAIKRLRYEKPNLQICIHNQEIIDQYMSFRESEEI